jgi:hypothetical protein
MISEMCLDSVVKVTVFNEIVKKKEEHTQTLTKLRNSYEEITKAEIKVQRTQDKILSKLKSLDIDSYVAQKLTEKQTSLLKSFNLIK